MNSIKVTFLINNWWKYHAGLISLSKVVNESILSSFLWKLMGIKKKKLKKLLTSYAIIFGQRTLFSIIKFVFWGKREFYLIYYNAIFKVRVLFK